MTLIAPATADFRAGLTEGFEKKYGITVEYTGIRGAEVAPRVAAERQAGQYVWDVFVGGNSTALNGLMPRPGSITTEDVKGLAARAELHPYLEELFGKS